MTQRKPMWQVLVSSAGGALTLGGDGAAKVGGGGAAAGPLDAGGLLRPCRTRPGADHCK
jgi:hypothetical protein